MAPALLSVRDLRIETRGAQRALSLVDGVSFEIKPRETVALVGESGCGKSLTSLAILQLLPDQITIAAGHIELDGRDLLALPPADLRRVRGNQVAMIFQEPMTALNPVLRVGEQIAEPLRVHRGLSAAAARLRAIELLTQVGIAEPARRIDAYPHELSGGMRQRVMIACAIACEPRLLIADEPTTALDVTVQAQIVALLRNLREKSDMGMLFITHDLALVSEIADRVCVMYAGAIVESAPTSELLASPRHPYTEALLRSIPDRQGPPIQRAAGMMGHSEGSKARRASLPVIPGEVARPAQRPSGCAFHPRCDQMQGLEKCSQEKPVLVEISSGHECACWRVTA